MQLPIVLPVFGVSGQSNQTEDWWLATAANVDAWEQQRVIHVACQWTSTSCIPDPDACGQRPAVVATPQASARLSASSDRDIGRERVKHARYQRCRD